jgi:hypothetical protein
VYSHCNMCNIPIYFCNIQIKHMHLKYLKHTFVTCAFNVMSPCTLEEWRRLVAKLYAGAEVGDDTWSSPVRQ